MQKRRRQATQYATEGTKSEKRGLSIWEGGCAGKSRKTTRPGAGHDLDVARNSLDSYGLGAFFRADGTLNGGKRKETSRFH